MTVEDAGPYKVFEARYKAPPHPMHVGAISDRPPHNRFDVKTVTLGQNRKTSTTKHKTRAIGAGLYIMLFPFIPRERSCNGWWHSQVLHYDLLSPSQPIHSQNQCSIYLSSQHSQRMHLFLYLSHYLKS